MSFTRLALASVVILGLSAGPLPAAEPAAAPGAAEQANREALISAIQSNRKALVVITDGETATLTGTMVSSPETFLAPFFGMRVEGEMEVVAVPEPPGVAPVP